jgi:hypothetical protein
MKPVKLILSLLVIAGLAAGLYFGRKWVITDRTAREERGRFVAECTRDKTGPECQAMLRANHHACFTRFFGGEKADRNGYQSCVLLGPQGKAKAKTATPKPSAK